MGTFGGPVSSAVRLSIDGWTMNELGISTDAEDAVSTKSGSRKFLSNERLGTS